VRANSGNAAGAQADYDAAIGLRGTRRRLGADWPLAWAAQLAAGYMNRGILLKDTCRLEDAVVDWDEAIRIYLNLVKRGQLRASSQLLQAVFSNSHFGDGWLK
jgi:hypothetical protein